MAIYRQKDLSELLKNQHVLLLGDSVQRSIYKDFVVLSKENRFLSHQELRAKGEPTFCGDNLISRSELTNGIGYREEREYVTKDVHLKFCFLTRVYNDYVESLLKAIQQGSAAMPDVIVLNSCLWDISRYGVNSMSTYRDNLEKLCARLKEILPATTLVIWRTTLPVSHDIKGGFMTKDAEWVKDMLRLDVMRANYYAYIQINKNGYDVADLHYNFQFQLHRQARDGVHWNMYAHRRVSNILLSHIARAWDIPVPQLPWQDDSEICFNESDIIFNRTNVLRQAYLHQEGRPPRRQNPTEYRSASVMYSDVYTVPNEIHGENDYEIINPKLSTIKKVPALLPNAPYRDMQNRGPLRLRHSNNSSKSYRRPGRASEMIRERLHRERQHEMSMLGQQWANSPAAYSNQMISNPSGRLARYNRHRNSHGYYHC